MNKSTPTAAQIDALFADSIRTMETARAGLAERIGEAALLLADTLAAGNKILICGNGGSASDSLHFSSELVNKFERRRRPLPAISLAADVAALTSIANDESYEMVFAKQVRALAARGDVLVLITSSGNSPNIIAAARAAQDADMRCIALNGKNGGRLSACLTARDLNLVVPSDSTARVQEVHGIIIHIFCDLIDRQLFGERA